MTDSILLSALSDREAPYPRICAHRGFNTVAPENSLPAFGAAAALGAEEIEFDLWAAKDGEIVSCHDPVLDRVSDGRGTVSEHTYAELLALDFGIKHSEHFRGLRIPTFEEILARFGRRIIMNVHVKIWDNPGENDHLEQLVALIRRYHCEDYVYFMSSNDRMLRKASEYAPEIRCCVGWNGDPDPLSMVNRAIALNAYKIQLFKPYFTQETVDLAHENGILCNVFYADDPEEAVRYRRMGIDTVLTNDYLAIKRALEHA